jgi:hypothetical protein
VYVIEARLSRGWSDQPSNEINIYSSAQPQLSPSHTDLSATARNRPARAVPASSRAVTWSARSMSRCPPKPSLKECLISYASLNTMTKELGPQLLKAALPTIQLALGALHHADRSRDQQHVHLYCGIERWTHPGRGCGACDPDRDGHRTWRPFGLGAADGK